MNELIAYRTVNSERDVWCERAFLFKTEEAVLKFFALDNPFFVNLFTDEDDRRITDFEMHYPGGKIPSAITFFTEYAGDVRIYQMLEGYNID